MIAIRSFATLSLAALVTACASPGATDTTAGARMSPTMSHGGTPMPMAAMEPRMKAMKDMHQKMLAAKSPAERQAMMAEHMKSMQDGMAMMKEMHGGMQGMSGMTGLTSMGDGKVMQAEMAKREKMMADHSAMMQMMMDMMAQRMPASPAPQ